MKARLHREKGILTAGRLCGSLAGGRGICRIRSWAKRKRKHLFSLSKAVKKLCFLTDLPGIFLLQKSMNGFLQRSENPERSTLKGRPGLQPRMSIYG
jgi:hypothetical protein